MFSKQLDFESAATYYPYLLEEYFVRRRNDKMSEEIVFKWFINSYAKACKFIFEEKFSEAEKVVRQNIVSWRRMMNEMKKLKLEKYTSILNDLSDRRCCQLNHLFFISIIFDSFSSSVEPGSGLGGLPRVICILAKL